MTDKFLRDWTRRFNSAGIDEASSELVDAAMRPGGQANLLVELVRYYATRIAVMVVSVTLAALLILFLVASAVHAKADDGCTLTTYPNGSKLISCHYVHSSPTATPAATSTPLAGEVRGVTIKRAIVPVPVPRTGGAL